VKLPLTPMRLGIHVPGCEKIAYPSRKIAKKAANLIKDHHLSPYRCPKNENHFHIGHLAPAIMTGKMDRRYLYNHP